MDAKRVVPCSCDDVITAEPSQSHLWDMQRMGALLEASIVARPVKTNVTSVEGVSNVREILL